MGFFGIELQPEEQNSVIVPPGWRLQFCTAAFDPSSIKKGTKVARSTLWIKVEDDVDERLYVLGSLTADVHDGKAYAQIPVPHELTSADGRVVLQARGQGVVHLTGFFARGPDFDEEDDSMDDDYWDGGDDSSGMEEESDDDIDENGQTHGITDALASMAESLSSTEEGAPRVMYELLEETATVGETGPGKSRRKITAASTTAAITSPAAGDARNDDDSDGVGDADDDGVEDEGVGKHKRQNHDKKANAESQRKHSKGKGVAKEQRDAREGSKDKQKKPSSVAGSKEIAAANRKRGAKEVDVPADSPAAKKIKDKGSSQASPVGEVASDEVIAAMTKQERKRQRKKENKRKAAEAKRALEEAFQTSEKDDGEPPTEVPLKNPRTKTLKGGLKIKDTVIGSGKMAVLGRNVKVVYEGCFPDGRVFDKNQNRRRPLQFRLGMKNVIPGMDKGVEGMHVGGSREIAIPAALGYGSRGTGPIPPNQDLVFKVELLDVLGK